LSVFALAVGGTSAAPMIFAGTDGGGVVLSIDNGTTWTAVNFGLTDLYLRALWVSGSNLFAGSSHGVYVSSNNGTSWTKASTGLPNTTDIRAFEQYGTNLYAGNYSDGVYISANNGTSWTVDTIGLRSLSVRSLAVSGTNLFAGTGTGIVYRLAVGAGVSQNELPFNFRLEQNYPNPFNASTDITFVLAQRGVVSLDVFDMLGRKIQTLVNRAMDAGTHIARFDAENLLSGIYTASLTMNNERRELKMILGK
jgi:Secretion system C-terminal sorting domain